MTERGDDNVEDYRRTASEPARALFDDALVWDMTLPWIAGWTDEDITLPRFRRAGISFVSLTVNDFPGSVGGTMSYIARVSAQIRARVDTMTLVHNVDDIRAAKKSGKLALAFNLQETNPLEGSVDMIQAYYDVGVRHMLLAYNKRNSVGDGCAERTDAGLSRFGVRAIKEMNRVGMLVDGTHTGYRTTIEAMEVCSAPFIFSHCLAYGLFPHYRNIRDDQIKACAKSGGIIGVNGVGQFLNDPAARSESIFRHIDYIAEMVGPEHIGIGMDHVRNLDVATRWQTENPDLWPPNEGHPHTAPTFAQPEQLLELTDIMLKHRYGETEVRGILGENFARVAAAVWK